MSLSEYVDEYPKCEREVGSVARGWHLCGRNATTFQDREHASGGRWRIYYCRRHATVAPGLPSVTVAQYGAVVRDAR